MKAEAIPLLKLYDTHNKAYIIPLYQRPFAWNASKAEDLLNAILEDAISSAPLTSLGTLLFCNIPDTTSFGDSTPTTTAPQTLWEVVDGQQRLTVFSLIGHALYTRLEELKDIGFTYTPSTEFEMLYSTSRTRKGKTVPVIIRDGDNYDRGFNSDIAIMLDVFSNNTGNYNSVGERLKDTYNAIVKWTSENLTTSNFNIFSEYFFFKCKIVQVIADDQNTAFNMFEPLNSTSEPLTAFEVYRSKVIRALSKEFPKTELLLNYEKNKRDDVISRSNSLIFSMAQVYSGERPRIHFVPLKNYLDHHVSEGFINFFEEAADFFRTIWIEQTAIYTWFDEEAKNCIRFLKAVSHDIAIPLILRYYLTNKDDVAHVLKIIVGFYGLWRASFLTKALPKIYRDLLTKGSQDDISIEGKNLIKEPKDLAQYFREALIKKTGISINNNSSIVYDNWIKNIQLNYDDQKNLCRLYVFIDMNATLKSNLVPNDPWTAVDDIEHIYASAWTPSVEDINKIGNLTFLPPQVNRSIKDAAFDEKWELYKILSSTAKQICPDLYSCNGKKIPDQVKDFINNPNSPALSHLVKLTSSTNWDNTTIQNRSSQMLQNVWSVLYDQWLNI